MLLDLGTGATILTSLSHPFQPISSVSQTWIDDDELDGGTGRAWK
jgi:hypothetical protein